MQLLPEFCNNPDGRKRKGDFDMIVKIAVPQRFQFKMAAGFGDVLFPKPGDTHYIGGSEVLPPPLEP